MCPTMQEKNFDPNNKKSIIFDKKHAQQINYARMEFFDKLLPIISKGLSLKTALDCGCGPGYFSKYLKNKGFTVTAFDIRKENVAEAKKRHKGISFCVSDIEDRTVRNLGTFDLVLCTGLLYHLENPFAAVRNLAALTRRLAIIETCVAPGKKPMAKMCAETLAADQAINSRVLVPTENGFVSMLQSAGFIVYKPTFSPRHHDFLPTFSKHKLRRIFVVAKKPLSARLLKKYPVIFLDRSTILPWRFRWMVRAYYRFVRPLIKKRQ